MLHHFGGNMLLFSKICRKCFPLQITRRIYLWTISATFVPLLLMLIINTSNTLSLITSEREQDLFAVVNMLDHSLSAGFNEILKDKGALYKSTDEQAKILNNALQPFVDDALHFFPGINTGYYSIDLDRVLAGGPNFTFSNLISLKYGKPPYFNVYKTGKAEFGESIDNMHNKRILYYARPIYRDGKIIGHIWANVNLEYIYLGVIKKTWFVFLLWFFICIITLTTTFRMSKEIKNDLEGFAQAVINRTPMLEPILPELNPILNYVKGYTTKLYEEQRRLFSLLDGLPFLLWLQAPDFTIKFANKMFHDIFGKPKKNHCFELLLNRKKPCEDCNIESSEHQYINDRVYEIYSRPFADVDGSSLVLKIGLDITDKKKAESEMARLDRIDTIGEVAAGIAHEIRNPMTTIKGFLQIINEKAEFVELKDYCEIMLGEVNKANEIITEFLSIAKNNYVPFEFQNINNIIKSCQAILLSEAIKNDKNVLVELEDVIDLPLNKREMSQLILNITRNGLEAMDSGGILKIRTFMDGNDVVLSIEDQGKGIGKDILNKLGTPFLTTKEQGTGLGLAVSYSIAQRHNATVDVKTSLSGTTFYVRFAKQ